ncbi:MAG: ADP-ribosylglycohydrolase family protein, partial [Deltaproteobacteria bacterium]|nr:ADP-ribosylglycohydrolase family protein [Deltaproteobacteria bacterium]
MSDAAALARALKSLEGLSLGDAFGQRFFDPARAASVLGRQLPPAM